MTDDLGAATDRLNESFELLEGALTSMNFGVPASVELETHAGKQSQRLTFGKTSGGWKLLIERDGHEPVALLSTSRETRLRAAARVEDLLLGLGDERTRQIRLVLEAVEKVDALTARIAR